MDGCVDNVIKVKASIKSAKRRSSSGVKSSSTTKKGKSELEMGVKAKSSEDELQTSDQRTAAASGACLEGMTAAELTMVRRLAGNDPLARKKTMRKMKKWLAVLAQKVPDSPDCRSMIEPNFIRVWKALFYCMWMADKPLPQEQLAESISDLQKIFGSKTNCFLVFVEWFLRTMAREWNLIDRLRIDKFMMLFRRFVRKTMQVIAEKNWHNSVLEGFIKVVSIYVFNRYPTLKSKKGDVRSPQILAPVGLQIHFVDIFMEELAKVGGETLKFQKILKILTPFIHELGFNNDDRLLDEIRERIFHHLMRQSDVGMDYQEQLAYGNLNFGANEMESSGEFDTEHDDAVFEEEEEMEPELESDIGNGALDPRAGVDVILPQLDVDYGKMYEKLIEFGGQKDVKLKNRRILYTLASQFKEITAGKYPFALPDDDGRKPAIPRKEISSAAKRLLNMEMEGAEVGGKRRKSKKGRKREAKKRLNASQQSIESVGSEDDSQYINDDELLEHVTDNYMSYLENEVEGKPTSNSNDLNEDEEEDQEINSNKRKKTKESKGRKRKWKTIVEVEADELSSTTKASSVASPDICEETQTEEVVLIKRPKLNKRGSISKGEKSPTNTPLKGKIRRVSELAQTPSNKSSLLNNSLNSASKRVSFVLAKNKEHEHADYSASIARSPAIPFDKNRRPSGGLLKSPATTPKSDLKAFVPKKRHSAIGFLNFD